MTSHEQRLAATPPAGGSPLDRVHGFFRVTTEAMCSRPHLARALVRAVVAGGPDLSQRVAAFHSRMETLIARALRGRGGAELPSEIERRVGMRCCRLVRVADRLGERLPILTPRLGHVRRRTG